MDNLLEFKELYRSMGNGNAFIKESGRIESGGILSVQGASGAGKSTLLRMLARLIRPEGGDMWLQGRSWRSVAPEAWRRRVHYLSQKPVMFPGTVEENLAIPFAIKIARDAGRYQKDKAAAWMDRLDLPQEILGQNAQNISGGEASRIALIRAMLLEPEILLLDEPTAYLDNASRSNMVRTINEWVGQKQPRGVVIVSHTPEDLAYLNNISVLEITRGVTDLG